MQDISTQETERTSRAVKSPFKTTLATVPRIMRSRIVKATKPKSSTKRGNISPVDINNQPIARNGSGKIALGPWTGPFGTESHSDDTTVLYIDRAGSTHKELNEAVLQATETGAQETGQRSPKAHRKGTILDPSASGETPVDDRSMKLRVREMEKIQQKSTGISFGRNACGKQVTKGRVSNRVGMINQPKKGL